MDRLSDADLTEEVRKELRFLFEHENTLGYRIVEGIEALIEMKITAAVNEMADRLEVLRDPSPHKEVEDEQQ